MPLDRRVFAVALSALSGFCVTGPASAQITIQQYETWFSTPGKTREEIVLALGFYFEGIAGGIHWMAGEYVNEHKAKPLFCWQPGDLPRLVDYTNLIDRELRERPERWSKDQPVARVAVEALRRYFPCK